MIPDKELIMAAAVEMEAIAKDLGLSCYPQVFEWVTPSQMAMLIARDGARMKYPHWSYGKAYRRSREQSEVFGETFVAHELVFNADPCVAYLVENTVTPLMALVIGHVYGHNDFFRNNVAFRGSNAAYLLPLRDARAARVRELEETPGIGVARVEEVLDAARTLMYHRTGIEPASPLWLEFIANKNPRLEDWERDLILMVHDEAKEELRAIRTKHMNEGWASFWQMDFISRASTLPYAIKAEAARFHAALTAPPGRATLGCNPYNIGMLLWRSVRDRFGREALFAARAEETDASFFERYLTQDVGAEANLAWFEFDQSGLIVKRMIPAADAGPEDWARIKSSVISTLPINSIPLVVYGGITKDGALVMHHYHDGRDLDLPEAKYVVSQVARRLWKASVWFVTEAGGNECRFRANCNGEVS